MLNLSHVFLLTVCLLNFASAADTCSGDLCTFKMEFGSDFGTGAKLAITGQYPNTRAAQFVGPIVYLRGTQVPPSVWQDITSIAKQVNTVVATLQWSQYDGSDFAKFKLENEFSNGTFLCDDFYTKKAKQLFGNSSDTGLSVLCSHPRIDCSQGVGVAGYSQGADIGHSAPTLDSRVKGYLGLAATHAYYAKQTPLMVMDTNSGNFSSPPWTLLPCKVASNNPLNNGGLRFLIGANDDAWNTGKFFNKSSKSSPATQRNINIMNSRVMSGHYCNDKADCLQQDGTGYFIVENGDHEGLLKHHMSKVTDGFVWLSKKVGSGSSNTTLPPTAPTPKPSAACAASFDWLVVISLGAFMSLM